MVRVDFDVHPYERFFYRLCAVFLLLFTINTIIFFAIRLVAKLTGKNILKFNLFKTILVNVVFLLIITFVFVTLNFFINGFV